MNDPDDSRQLNSSPPRATVVPRRLIRAFIIFDILVIAAVLVVWIFMRADAADAERANAVNEGLRGSKPPAEAAAPQLDQLKGLDPAITAAMQSQPSAQMIVATCMECRSGDVIGGFLGRLADDDLPEQAQALVVGWGGDPHAWRAKWMIPERIAIHVAQNEPDAQAIRTRLGIEESGITFLVDGEGAWRSTFHLNQLNRDDVAYDLKQLAGS